MRHPGGYKAETKQTEQHNSTFLASEFLSLFWVLQI